MKKLYAILFIFVCIGLDAQLSQLQTAHWYFGFHAGLDFTSGEPVIDTNGQLYQLEGCTSISDEYGNLLFYTEGRYVYDRTHNIMDNGTGLHGDNSSTTSAIVLPVPDDCNLYYIFTIDCRDEEVPSYRPKRGIEYNIVDMSLNGGLGAVIQKNISVPINGVVQGYEKLAAISNADKTGYWVVTHFEGNFYAFSVTGEGVNMNPVVSPTEIYGGSLNIGYLKASSDGSKLAMGMCLHHFSTRSLSVYDFNNATGEVSNEIIIKHPETEEEFAEEPEEGEPWIKSADHFYGVEFSPNNNLLYITVQHDFYKYFESDVFHYGGWEPWGNSTREVVQYNLTAPSIVESKYILHTGIYGGALLKGLDGKIYVNTYFNGTGHYLGRIENPDTAYNPVTGEGPVFTPEYLDFGSIATGIGLPTFLNNYFRIAINVNGLSISEEQQYCTGIELEFNFCSQGGEIESIHWDFGDGEESTEFYPQHYYNDPGTYTITLTLIVDGEEYIRTFEITITGPPNVEDAG